VWGGGGGCGGWGGGGGGGGGGYQSWSKGLGISITNLGIYDRSTLRLSGGLATTDNKKQQQEYTAAYHIFHGEFRYSVVCLDDLLRHLLGKRGKVLESHPKVRVMHCNMLVDASPSVGMLWGKLQSFSYISATGGHCWQQDPGETSYYI